MRGQFCHAIFDPFLVAASRVAVGLPGAEPRVADPA